MRDGYPTIRELGAEVVAIGTGDERYARWFVDDYRIPYPVLVDDHAEAARAASIRRVGLLGLFHPDSFPGAARAWRAGHRIGIGKRTDQLGASFVVGPGDRLRYQHRDRHTADHAPLEEILAVLREAAA